MVTGVMIPTTPTGDAGWCHVKKKVGHLVKGRWLVNSFINLLILFCQNWIYHNIWLFGFDFWISIVSTCFKGIYPRFITYNNQKTLGKLQLRLQGKEMKQRWKMATALSVTADMWEELVSWVSWQIWKILSGFDLTNNHEDIYIIIYVLSYYDIMKTN